MHFTILESSTNMDNWLDISLSLLESPSSLLWMLTRKLTYTDDIKKFPSRASVVQTSNPSTQMDRLWVWGQTDLHSNFPAFQSYAVRLSNKKKRIKKKILLSCTRWRVLRNSMCLEKARREEVHCLNLRLRRVKTIINYHRQTMTSVRYFHTKT